MEAWLWAVLTIVPFAVGMVVERLLEVTRNKGDGRGDNVVPFLLISEDCCRDMVERWVLYRVST